MGSQLISPQDEVRRVLDGLRRVVQLLRESAAESERRFGLSSAQLFVLGKLRDHGRISLGSLAELTATHQSSVSVVVSRLVENGLVARRPSKSDARRLELSLTPQGRRLIARAPDATQERLFGAIEELPAAWRAQLGRSLERIADRMAVPSPAPMFFEDRRGRRS
jgi:DNA-binding MarR family transcriptional regulator